jgi:tetratricopeptide (TPR) repeat protein
LEALDAFQKGASTGNSEQMEAAALNAFVAAAEEAERNPSASLLLKNAASECEARGDWAGAEARYREVLALEEASGNHGLIFKARYDLSGLFQLLGNLERASAWVLAATDSARQADCFPLLFMALENQARFALKRSDYAGALEAASEAVAIVKPEPMSTICGPARWCFEPDVGSLRGTLKARRRTWKRASRSSWSERSVQYSPAQTAASHCGGK